MSSKSKTIGSTDDDDLSVPQWCLYAKAVSVCTQHISRKKKAKEGKKRNIVETSVCAGHMCIGPVSQCVCETEEEVSEEKFIKNDTLISGQPNKSKYTKNQRRNAFLIQSFMEIESAASDTNQVQMN